MVVTYSDQTIEMIEFLSRFLFATLFVFGVCVGHAGPDLYLDGEALADVMTEWSLQNTDARVRSQDRRQRSTRMMLYTGDQFRKEDAADRKALVEWMLSQPDRTITPDTLYAKAIELSNGHIQSGMSLVWDVLSDKWYRIPIRNETPLSKKLIDITGELESLDGHFHVLPKYDKKGKPKLYKDGSPQLRAFYTKRGDNHAAWYHFAGTSLNSFMRQNSRLSLLPGYTDTKIMVAVEESVHLGSGVDKLKRVNIDLAGAKFGSRLAKNLRKYKTVESYRTAVRQTDRGYLYDAPEIYGPKYHLKPGQHPRDFGTPRTTLGMEDTVMTTLELKSHLAFAHDEAGRLVTDPIYNALTKNGKRLQTSIQAYFDSGVSDPDVDRELLGLLRPAGNYYESAGDDWYVNFDDDLSQDQRDRVRQLIYDRNKLIVDRIASRPNLGKDEIEILKDFFNGIAANERTDVSEYNWAMNKYYQLPFVTPEVYAEFEGSRASKQNLFAKNKKACSTWYFRLFRIRRD